MLGNEIASLKVTRKGVGRVVMFFVKFEDRSKLINIEDIDFKSKH